MRLFPGHHWLFHSMDSLNSPCSLFSFGSFQPHELHTRQSYAHSGGLHLSTALAERFNQQLTLFPQKESSFTATNIATAAKDGSTSASRKKRRRKKKKAQADLISALSVLTTEDLHIDSTWTNVPLMKGMRNSDNRCFFNVIIQSLFVCAPFVNFIFQLRNKKLPENARILQWCSGLSYGWQFENISSSERLNGLVENMDFKYCEDSLLNEFRRSTSSPTDTAFAKHEDAHEFLCYFMNRIHDELNSLPRAKQAGLSQGDEENPCAEEWVEVGKGNKTSTVLETKFSTSVITQMFCARVRSVLRRRGVKPSITFQPYDCLPLDISSDRINTLEEALLAFFAKETIEGINQSNITRHMSLETFPSILVFQLKRFAMDLQTRKAVKLNKCLSYPLHLSLPEAILSPQISSVTGVLAASYQLVAVVSHHGFKASGGHYTCCVYSKLMNAWLNVDDLAVQHVSEAKALQKEAYLLFYTRSR